MPFKRVAFIVCMTVLGAMACASESEKRDAHFEKGTAYARDGHAVEALLEYKNSVQIDPAFIKGWYQIAGLSIEQGDFKEAFRGYSKVVERNPDHGDAHFNLAMLYMLAKKKLEARDHIDKALGLDPDNMEYMLLSAAIFAEEGESARAMAVYERSLALEVNDIRPHRHMARLMMTLKDFSGAEGSLRKAMVMEPDDIPVRLDLVGLMIGSGQQDRAEQELKAVVKRHQGHVGLLLILGDFYLGQKKFTTAESTYFEAMSTDPSAIAPVMKLALYYEQRGDFEKAEVMYSQGASLEPENLDVAVLLARFYFNREAVDKTDKVLAEVMTQNKDFLPALVLKGEVALYRKEFDSAVMTLTSVISQGSKHADAFYLRGVAYMALGSDHLARTDLLRALEIRPQYVKARLVLAELDIKEAEFALAKEELHKILEQHPSLYKANLFMGDVLAATGEPEKALQAYGKLMTLAPENPIAFFRSGLVYLQGRQLDLAHKNFVRARAINPHLMDVFQAMVRCLVMKKEQTAAFDLCRDQLRIVNEFPLARSKVYLLMGELYVQADDLKNAELAYKAAIENNPDAPPPYYGLASVYHRQGNTEKVIAQLERITQQYSEDAHSYVLLGIMHEARGDLAASKANYRKALGIKADIAAAANNLAYILAEENEALDEAFELARTAKGKASDDPNVMDTLGFVYLKKGLYDSAISEFNDSLKKKPENPVVNYHLGLALHASGKLEKAKKSLIRSLELSPDFKGAEEARAILARN